MPTLTDAMAGSLANDQWITHEAEDPTPLPRLPGWKLLVRPVPVRAKTKGGILLPDNARGDMEYLNTVGRVLAVGDLAFKFEENRRTPLGHQWLAEDYPPWCAVGDYVVYAKYAGQKMTYKGVKLLLIKDRDVEFIVPDPQWLDPNA